MTSTLIEILREARAPVLAGVTWMVTVWLALREGIDPAVSHSATANAIARLSAILGKAGGLLLLAFVAVGLGAISQQVFRAPSIWIANAVTSVVRFVEAIVVRMLARNGRSPALRRFSSWEPVAVDLARRIIHRHQSEVANAAPADMERTYEHALYVEIDRLKSRELQRTDEEAVFLRTLDDQARLRLTAVVPLIALVAAAATRLSVYFTVLAPAPFIVAFQAGTLRALRDPVLERRIWQTVDLDAVAAELDATSVVV